MATIGYQHTEVGVFPSEWEAVTISELGPISKGKGISRSECGTGTIPCIRYGELYTDYDNYVKNFRSYISDIVASTSRKLHYGELLFAGSGETKEEIGKCAAYVNDCEAYAGGDIVIVTPNLEKYDPLFLGFLMNDSYVVRQKALRGQGDAVVHITGKTLGSVQLVVPPTLVEQRKIAKALSDIDGLIDSLSKLIEKKKNIKTGTMQELLTGKKRLTGFSKPWEYKKLSELGFMTAGGTPSTMIPEYWDGNVNWLQSGVVHDCVVKESQVDKHITLEGLQHSSAHLIKKDSVLIAITGATCANVAYLPFESSANQSVVSIETNSGSHPYFLYNLLKMYRGKILEMRSGSAQGGVSLTSLKELNVYLPASLKEQAAIASILTDMDKEIAALEKKKAKYEYIKKGMMQELLSGRIRLV